jgi:hypothetical protein
VCEQSIPHPLVSRQERFLFSRVWQVCLSSTDFKPIDISSKYTFTFSGNVSFIPRVYVDLNKKLEKSTNALVRVASKIPGQTSTVNFLH